MIIQTDVLNARKDIRSGYFLIIKSITKAMYVIQLIHKFPKLIAINIIGLG
jgi:hypothetical protein